MQQLSGLCNIASLGGNVDAGVHGCHFATAIWSLWNAKNCMALQKEACKWSQNPENIKIKRPRVIKK